MAIVNNKNAKHRAATAVGAATSKAPSTSKGSPTNPAVGIEEATVVDESAADSAAVTDATAALDLLTTISLSSAAPASADLCNELQIPAAAPVVSAKSGNTGATPTPAAVIAAPSSPVSTASFNADLLSCFAPLGRLWPYSLFGWSGPKKCINSSDSDAENYEIPIDTIDVQWDTNYIGGGNQSSVFRGRYRGQWIALKKLNRTSEVDIKRLCSLDHPNVIRTLGICTRENFPCIVMEYCQQGSLFEHLRQNPHISKSQFISYAVQLAEGMQYLHSLKIAHRDLKSPNVLIDNNNTLKICDFGSLYTWDQRITSQNHNPQGMASVVMSVCGTSQWMSPEMLTQKPCNERVDVWSYAVVLWELLVGEVPYDKVPPTTVWFLVGSGELQLHVPKSVPGSISFLLTVCWAKNPRNRPSFKTILKDLLGNVRSQLGELQEEGWRYRREQWRREIAERTARLHNSGMDLMGERQKEQELVQKRMHELRHAQEIRQMYEEKLGRVDKMHTKMCRLVEQMNERKWQNVRTERALEERGAHDAHWHQTLHAWHNALGDAQREFQNVAGTKMKNRAELQHIVLRAEAARKAAMHARQDVQTAEIGTSQQQIAARSVAGGRPAMLRMTYYDSDGGGRRERIAEQQVTAATAYHTFGFGERRKLPGARKLRRDAISSPMASGTAASCSPSCSSCSSSSSASSSDDDANRQHPRQKPKKTKHHRRQNNNKSRNSPKHSQQQQQRHVCQTQISSCPSECASVSRNSSMSFRQSTDLPFSGMATKPISRDDSAISSTTVPFSPSDRSLQSISAVNNNNFGLPMSSSMNCMQTPCNNNNNNCMQLPESGSAQLRVLQLEHAHQQFFARNSVARASGLSADSGVCQEDDCLEPNGNCCQLGLPMPQCCLAPNSCQCATTASLQTASRTASARWSVEARRPHHQLHNNEMVRAITRARARSHHVPHACASSGAFMRNSPLRTPSRASRRRYARPASRVRRQQLVEQQTAVMTDEIPLELLNNNDQQMATINSSSSAATLVEKNEDTVSKGGWFSTPELCQAEEVEAETDDEEEEDSEQDDDDDEAMPEQCTKLCPISEMTDSQVTERAMATEKAMLESLSSTMVSSLERSLEISAAHSDGLSDKEAKLKEVKTTFKLTHRRTASNPTTFSTRVQQQQQKVVNNSVKSTTESDEKDDEVRI